MSIKSRTMFPFQSSNSERLLLPINVLVGLFLLALTAISLRAQKAGEAPNGIAWRVQGPWHVEGKRALILAGDAILPGSLLQPGEGISNHSITILLPDGQRILYECFTVEDCSRGFRVPSLYRRPDAFAIDLLGRIQAVLARGHEDLPNESSGERALRLPRDEEVAVLGPDNHVHVEGLVEHLPNGRYAYDLRPFEHRYPRQSHLVLEKETSSISLALPSSGLYALTISDELKTSRIDLLVAAITPAQVATIQKSFSRAKALMVEWNADYQGWPVHDFQRAYLESLMLGVKPLTAGWQTGRTDKVSANAGAPVGLDRMVEEQHGKTAEPSYFPKPGVYSGDTAVTIRCNMQDATIHYTIDGSQPMASSPLYGAPIMVKGTELTVKSFASVAGKHDSAVVTGIFRIRE